MSNHADVMLNNVNVEINQVTSYPWDGKINMTILPEKAKKFTIKLRLPGWAQNKVAPGDLYAYTDVNAEEVILKVNGQETKKLENKGYLIITREWAKGDHIEIILPMKIRKMIADENIQDTRNKVAFGYGPLVYCAEEIDNGAMDSTFSISDRWPFMIEKETLLSNQVNVIKSKTADHEFKLIPYYLWSNRGIGDMKVWFSQKSE
jgi:DUF1680 family protein